MNANASLLGRLGDAKEEARSEIRRIKALLTSAEDKTRIMIAASSRTVKETVYAWTMHREAVAPLRAELAEAELIMRHLYDIGRKIGRGTYNEETTKWPM